MTAKIVQFPRYKRPPPEKPQSAQETLLSIFDTAQYWKSQGLGPQDIPTDIESTARRLIQLIVDPASYKDFEDEPKIEGN